MTDETLVTDAWALRGDAPPPPPRTPLAEAKPAAQAATPKSGDAITDRPTPTDPILGKTREIRARPASKRPMPKGKKQALPSAVLPSKPAKRWESAQEECEAVDLFDAVVNWWGRGGMRQPQTIVNGAVIVALIAIVIGFQVATRRGPEPMAVLTPTAAAPEAATTIDLPTTTDETAPADTTAAETETTTVETAPVETGTTTTEAAPVATEAPTQEPAAGNENEEEVQRVLPQRRPTARLVKPAPLPEIVGEIPYNAGGPLDLDNAAARQQYQEQNRLSAKRVVVATSASAKPMESIPGTALSVAPKQRALPTPAPPPAKPLSLPAAEIPHPRSTTPVAPTLPQAGSEKTLKDLDAAYERNLTSTQ